MTTQTYYVTYSDDEHEGPTDEFTNLFEATCQFYYLIELLEPNEMGELGELMGEDNEEMEGFLFSSPEDRE